MKPKIYFLTITQSQNLGDLLINKMLINEIATHSSTIYIDSNNLPDDFEEVLYDHANSSNVVNIAKEYSISLKGVKHFINALRFIKKENINYLFVSPGPKSLTTIYDLKTWVTLFIYQWAKYNNVKTYIIGADFHFKKKCNKIYNYFAIKFVTDIYLRDKETTSFFQKIGIKNIHYTPDLAFLYNKQIKSISTKKDTILISFRDLQTYEFKEQLYNSLQKIISQLISTELKIVFFYQVKCDYSFNYELYNKLKDKFPSKIYFHKELIWFNDIEKIYNTSYYIISNRLHVLLLGIMHDSIPVAILNSDEETNKIRKIFNGLSLSDNIIDINSSTFNNKTLQKVNRITLENLSDKIKNLINNILSNK